jgi:hypothetical protein
MEFRDWVDSVSRTGEVEAYDVLLPLMMIAALLTAQPHTSHNAYRPESTYPNILVPTEH